MIDEVKKITKNTAIYSMGNILYKLLGFLLIPVYTIYIPISSFGILALLEISILIFTSLFTFGIMNGHQRYYFIEKKSGNYGSFLFTNYCTQIILAALALSLLYIFAPELSKLLLGNTVYAPLFVLCLVITYFEILIIIPKQILQYEEKPFLFVLYGLINLTVGLATTIFLVVYKNYGLQGILLGRMLGSLISWLVGFFMIVLKPMKIKFNFDGLKRSMAYGIPLIISGIGYLIFTFSDRYMLNWLTDSVETGKYSFGLKIANFIYLILIQSIGISYLPYIFKYESSDDNKRFYIKMLNYYCYLLAVIILSFLFFYKLILSTMINDAQYWQGLVIVPLLSLNFLINGMNYFLTVGIYLQNKTQYYIIATFTAALVNISVNLMLIPEYGFIAPAIASFFAQLIYTAIIAYYSQSLLHIRFEWPKIFITILLAIIFYLAGTCFDPGTVLKIITRLALIALFPAVLSVLGLFPLQEIIKSIKLINKN
jgi:O-antigen/teichoic acid export membrane protein